MGAIPRERTGPAWFIMSLLVVNLIIDGAVEHGAPRSQMAIQKSFSTFCLAVYTIEMLLRIVGFGVWHSYPPPRPRAYFKRVACLLGKSPFLSFARALALSVSLYHGCVQNRFSHIHPFIFQGLDTGRATAQEYLSDAATKLDDCVVEWPDFFIVVISFAELIVLRINTRYSIGSLQYLRYTARTNPEN